MSEPSKIAANVFPTINVDLKITRKIGAGGMGTVYEAIQTKLNRKVAVKVLADRLASDPEFLERFEREARAAAVINHPNLVQVFDFGDADGLHYSVMEYIEGENLVQRLKRTGKLPPAEALEIIAAVAEALQSAWSKQIIHRDIKPENILITIDGRVKLADLGLAKILSEESSMTMTGMGLGSPNYMAPEQAEDAKYVDHRTDIYSLGITLLTLVTGKKPFKGNSPYALIKAHAEQPIPTGVTLGTELPDGMDNMIARMSAKRIEDRYQNYDDLLVDIMSLRSESNATISIPPEARSRLMASTSTNTSSPPPDATVGKNASFHTDPTVPSGSAFESAPREAARSRNYTLYAIVGITLAAVLYLIIDFARDTGMPIEQAEALPESVSEPGNPGANLQPGSLFGGDSRAAVPQSDAEIDGFLFGDDNPAPSPSSGRPDNSQPPAPPRAPPNFMMGIIRPGPGQLQFPVYMPMLPPPNDNPLPDTGYAQMSKAADDFATANPTKLRSILNMYEQVWHKAPRTEQPALQRIILSHLAEMDRAASNEIPRYQKLMQDALDANDLIKAKSVWWSFPTNLRSFRHDAMIWKAYTNTMPTDELQRHLQQYPIRSMGPPSQ